jgi:hypothetical protein
MRKMTLLVTIALLAICATVVQPAFATPTLTTSTAAEVAPFITPIGNTSTSQITGSSARMDFTAGGVTITCFSSMSGEIPTTHTRARISDLRFFLCVVSVAGIRATVTTTTTTMAPFLAHAKTLAGASTTGTVEIPAGGNVTISITGTFACTLTVGPQSIDATFTHGNTSLLVSDMTVAFVRAGSAMCPASGNGTLVGTYTVRPDTTTDDLRVTEASASR